MQGGDAQGKVLVLMSGGIDSTACAYFYKERGFLVEGLFVDYNQAAKIQEREAAMRVGGFLSVPIRLMTLQEATPKQSGELAGRNALLVFAALLEWRTQRGAIGIGLHEGSGYFDCSELFLRQVNDVFDGYTNGRIVVRAPFLGWSKKEVWDYFQSRSLPFDLTYSCELGLAQPCGRCRSCRDLEALNAGEINNR